MKNKIFKRYGSMFLIAVILLTSVGLTNEVSAEEDPGDLGYRFTEVNFLVNGSPLAVDDPNMSVGPTDLIAFDFKWVIDDLTDIVGGEQLIYNFPDVVNMGGSNSGGQFFQGPDHIGTWTLDALAKTLTVEFHAEAAGYSERSGEVFLNGQLRADTVAVAVPYELIVPVSGLGSKTYKLYFDVPGGSTINKSGIKDPSDFNVQQWSVDINTSADQVIDPIFIDNYGNELNYVENSLIITELEIKSDGSQTDLLSYDFNDYSIATVSNDPLNHTLRVDFNDDMTKAYRISYKTEVDLSVLDYNESVFTYVNNASFNNTSDQGTVIVERGKVVKKDGLLNKAYNGDEITWTISLNDTNYHLNGVVLVDTLPVNLELDLATVEVKYLNNDLFTAYTKALDSGVLTLDFSQGPVHQPLIITYKTTINEAAKDNTANVINFSNNLEMTYKIDGKTENYTATASSTKYIKKGQPVYKTSSADIGYDADKFMNWKVDFNLSEIDMGTNFVTDTFDIAKQTLVVDSLRVFNIDVADTGDLSGNGQTNTPNTFNGILTQGAELIKDTDFSYVLQAGGGFVLTFTNDITQAYRVIYQTKIVDYNSTMKNQGKIGSYTDTETINPDINNEYNKNSNSVDYGNNILAWTIRVNPEENGLTDLKVVDDFKIDQIMTQGQFDNISVKKAGSVFTDFTKTAIVIDGKIKGFELNFNTEVNNGVYVIAYNTTMDPSVVSSGGNLNYGNTADLTWTYEGLNGSKSLNKTPNINNRIKHNGFKSGVLKASQKTIDWTINTNYLSKEIEGAVLVDTIVGNQRFVEGSVKISAYKLNASGQMINVTEITDPAALGFIILADKANNTLEITYPANISKPYRIEYQTEFEGISQTKYENTAVMTYGSNTESYYAKVDYTDGDKFVEKSGQLKNAEYVDWTVIINKSQSTISDITLTDTLGVGLELVEDSFVLTDLNNTPLAAGDFEAFFDFTKEPQGLITDPLTFNLTSKLLITQSMKLTYRTLVHKNDVLENEVNNSISFQGNQVISGVREDSHTIYHTFFTGSGSGKGEVGSFTMTKVDKDDPTIKLEGVDFEFYKGERLLGTLTTDSNGEITVERLRYDSYTLKELNVPEGYKVDNAETTFVINGKVKQLLIIENERVRSIKIKKVEKDNIANVLAGAVFEIYDEEDNLVATVTTDNTGYANKVVGLGTYRVVEITPPSGYYKDAQPQEVTVDLSSVGFELLFKNTRIPTPYFPPVEEPEEPVDQPKDEPEEVIDEPEEDDFFIDLGDEDTPLGGTDIPETEDSDLPQTGESRSYTIYIGALLILLGGMLYYKNR